MKFDTIEKLLAMLLLQKANLPTFQAQVGATNTELQEVLDEAVNLQYLIDLSALVDANKKTITKIKQQVYNGDPDEDVSPFPVFPAIAAPVALVSGTLDRASKRNRRYKAAVDYTKEIGMALGIDGDTPPVPPESIKPTLDAFPAQSGYEAAIVVGNRGKSGMWKLFGRKMNAEKWSELTSGTGKSLNVKISPTVEGQPERIELKVQLYKANEIYGQQSNPTYATFNP